MRSAVLAVAARELRERRLIVMTAVVAGLLPFALRAVLADRGVGDAAGLLVGLGFSAAVALVLGATLVASDAASGRLRFFLARPLSASALWAGKLLAAVTLVLLSLLLTYVPALVVQAGWRFSLERGVWNGLGFHYEGPELLWSLFLLGFVFVLLLFLLGAAHVASTLYRAHSRWLALDLTVGTGLVTLLVVVLRRQLLEGMGVALARALPILLLAGAMVVLAAAAVQIAAGRADLTRGHGAFSISLWTLTALLAAAVWAWGGWLRRVSPGDLGAHVPLYGAPAGPGLVFGPGDGRGRAGFAPHFVFNAETGGWAQVSDERIGPPAFAADGRSAVWVAVGQETAWRVPAPEGHPDGRLTAEGRANGLWWPGRPGGALMRAHFEAQPTVDEVPLDPSYHWNLALAFDAPSQRAILTSREATGLVDSASGTVIAELPMEAQGAAFRPDGTVRVCAREGDQAVASLVVVDWDPGSGTRKDLVRVPGSPSKVRMAGDVVLGWLSRGRLVERAVVDVAHGAWHTFPRGPADLVLASGNVALTLPEGLRVVTPAGETVCLAALEGRSVSVIAETQPGLLAVGLFDPREVGWWRTVFVDERSGAVLREEQGVAPAAGSSLDRETAPAGSPGAQLFMDREHRLVRIGADGSRQVLVAGPE